MTSGLITAVDLQRLIDVPGKVRATVLVTRVKSTIGATPKRRRTVETGLGLRKTNASRLFYVNDVTGPVLKGMLQTAEGLVIAEVIDRRHDASAPPDDEGDETSEADGARMTETPYQAAGDGPALFFSRGKPTDERAEYVAVEAHEGFFALTWSSDTPLAAAVSDFLDGVARNRHERGEGGPSVAVVGFGAEATTTSIDEAVELVRKGDPALHLLRLELPQCTFVWSGQDSRPFAEIGVMSSVPARSLTRRLLKETGSPGVRSQADDLLKRASKVITTALKTA